MQKVHRRLHKLEQLPRFIPRCLLEHIKSLALQSLSQEDLDVLRTIAEEQAAGRAPRELSEPEATVCAGWEAALENEARRMGLKSLAEAKPTQRHRR